MSLALLDPEATAVIPPVPVIPPNPQSAPREQAKCASCKASFASTLVGRTLFYPKRLECCQCRQAFCESCTVQSEVRLANQSVVSQHLAQRERDAGHEEIKLSSELPDESAIARNCAKPSGKSLVTLQQYTCRGCEMKRLHRSSNDAISSRLQKYLADPDHPDLVVSFKPPSSPETIHRISSGVTMLQPLLEHLPYVGRFALWGSRLRKIGTGVVAGVILSDEIQLMLTPLRNLLGSFSTTEWTDMMFRIYYYACLVESRRKNDCGRDRAQHDACGNAPCPVDLLDAIVAQMELIECMYLCQLPWPYATPSHAEWYLSRLLAGRGWRILKTNMDSEKLLYGANLSCYVPAYALVVRVSEGGAKREAVLTIRGTTSIYDWCVNLTEEVSGFTFFAESPREADAESAEGSATWAAAGADAEADSRGLDCEAFRQMLLRRRRKPTTPSSEAPSSDSAGGAEEEEQDAESSSFYETGADSPRPDNVLSPLGFVAREGSFVEGAVHRGMRVAAQQILHQTKDGLLELLCDGQFDVVICGHSLGAGVGSIIAALLKVEVARRALSLAAHLPAEQDGAAEASDDAGRPWGTLQCVGIGTPACWSPNIAAALRSDGLVTAIVNATDIVPRFSQANVEQLRAALSDESIKAQTSRALAEDSKSAINFLSSMGFNFYDLPEQQPSAVPTASAVTVPSSNSPPPEAAAALAATPAGGAAEEAGQGPRPEEEPQGQGRGGEKQQELGETGVDRPEAQTAGELGELLGETPSAPPPAPPSVLSEAPVPTPPAAEPSEAESVETEATEAAASETDQAAGLVEAVVSSKGDVVGYRKKPSSVEAATPTVSPAPPPPPSSSSSSYLSSFLSWTGKSSSSGPPAPPAPPAPAAVKAKAPPPSPPPPPKPATALVPPGLIVHLHKDAHGLYCASLCDSSLPSLREMEIILSSMASDHAVKNYRDALRAAAFVARERQAASLESFGSAPERPCLRREYSVQRHSKRRPLLASGADAPAPGGDAALGLGLGHGHGHGHGQGQGQGSAPAPSVLAGGFSFSRCYICDQDVSWFFVLKSSAIRGTYTHTCSCCGKIVCCICAPMGDKVRHVPDSTNSTYEVQLEDLSLCVPKLRLLQPQRVCKCCYLKSCQF